MWVKPCGNVGTCNSNAIVFSFCLQLIQGRRFNYCRPFRYTFLKENILWEHIVCYQLPNPKEKICVLQNSKNSPTLKWQILPGEQLSVINILNIIHFRISFKAIQEFWLPSIPRWPYSSLFVLFNYGNFLLSYHTLANNARLQRFKYFLFYLSYSLKIVKVNKPLTMTTVKRSLVLGRQRQEDCKFKARWG
jgi:hypothetical protein